jgi:myo-inositol catabolism protein IolC
MSTRLGVEDLNINESLIEVKECLYYLCHPATSHGNYEDNKQSVMKYHVALQRKYNISIVNPIYSINATTDWTTSMKLCRRLFDICDGIILCPNWEKSEGCKTEAVWAIQTQRPIYVCAKDKFTNEVVIRQVSYTELLKEVII